VSDYRSLGLSAGTGALRAEYEQAGKAAYLAFYTAKGVHDETPWEKLVWAERYAWCEAARAVGELR
jgi:hypothetical protein